MGRAGKADDVAVQSALIEVGALKAALGSVIGAVESRNTIPVLANVALFFAPDHLRVVGTNMDQQVTRQVPCEAQASWSTTVGARLLKAMADKLPSGAEVQLSMDAGSARLIVRCGRARFELATLPVEDFPLLSDAGGWDAQFEMAGPELAAMLNHVKHAISTEETRYYLNGVFVERREAELIMVATDGHRLARSARPAPDGSEPMAEGEVLSGGVIIPRQVLALIEPMLKESRVEVALSAARVRLDAGEVTVISKLVDGQFPDWRRVVPSNNPALIEVDPAELGKAVERVTTICSDKTRAVKIAADADRLTLSVTSAENGVATEEVSCAYSSAPMTVGCNATYLLGCLARISGDVVQLRLADAAAPIRIEARADAEDLCVLMPMRV